MQANYVQRLRLTFSKSGSTRFIGHLDLARTLERSLSRARIPLAYTQGYNRRPRMQFAAELPLGFTSEGEIADIWLVERMEPQAVRRALDLKMAPGMNVKSIEDVGLKGPALQTMVSEAVYQVSFLDPIDWRDLQLRINLLMATERLERERRGRNYDLRPLIFDLEITRDEGSPTYLVMHLCLLPGKTGRPDEVLDQLGLDPIAAKIHRRTLILAGLETNQENAG